MFSNQAVRHLARTVARSSGRTAFRAFSANAGRFTPSSILTSAQTNVVVRKRKSKKNDVNDFYLCVPTYIGILETKNKYAKTTTRKEQKKIV